MSFDSNFTNLSKEATEYLSRLDATILSAQGRIITLRDIGTSERTYEDRTRLMARESNALRAELAKVNVDNFAGSIVRTLDSLPSKIELFNTFSKNPETARKQRLALDRLRKDVEFSNARLKKFIDKVTNTPAVDFAAFESVTPELAILKYALNYGPYIAGGIALDLAPFWALLFTMIAVGRLTRRDMVDAAALDTTAREIIQSLRSLAAINDPTRDHEEIESIKKHNRGWSEDDRKDDKDGDKS